MKIIKGREKKHLGYNKNCLRSHEKKPGSKGKIAAWLLAVYP